MENIADELKAFIEKYAQNIKVNSLLFEKSKTGELTREQVGLYLFNLYFILSQATVRTETALKVARSRGLDKLALFFEDLIEFEKGHDEWAVDDLDKFGFDELLLDSFTIVPAMKEISAFMHELAQRRPHSYIACHFYSAYIALLIGPEWLELLQLNCGISVTEVSIMQKYQLFDEEYNFNDFSKVENFTDGLDVVRVVSDLEIINKLFTLFLNEIATAKVGQ
jgi:hypothetical protein